MLVTQTLTTSKLLNYYAFTNQTVPAALTFSLLKNYTNISATMDTLVSSFTISTISQAWTTFACNTNGSFTVGNQTNFLTVSDFMQNQITNLVATNITNFNFALSL